MNPFTEARNYLGITQTHLSSLSGVSQQLIQRAEDGLNNSPPTGLADYLSKNWKSTPSDTGETPEQYWARFVRTLLTKFPNKKINQDLLPYLPQTNYEAISRRNPMFKLPSFDVMYAWYTNFERWSLPDMEPLLIDLEDAIKVNGEIAGSVVVVELADLLRAWEQAFNEDYQDKSDEWLVAKRLHLQQSSVQVLNKRTRVTSIPPTIKRIMLMTGKTHNEVF